MPRYHFNVHDGKSYPDQTGSEHADVEAARRHAGWYAGDLLREGPVALWDGKEWRMEVTDEEGLILFTLTFVAADAPALLGQAP